MTSTVLRLKRRQRWWINGRMKDEGEQKGGRQSDELQIALEAFINSLLFFWLVSVLTHLHICGLGRR